MWERNEKLEYVGFHRSALHPFSILVLTLGAYIFFFASRVEKTSIGPVSWEVSYLAIGEAGSSSCVHLQRHLAAAKAFEAPPRSSRCWVFFRTVFQKYFQRHQNPVAFELLSKNTWNSETQCHLCTIKNNEETEGWRFVPPPDCLELSGHLKIMRSSGEASHLLSFVRIMRASGGGGWVGGGESQHTWCHGQVSPLHLSGRPGRGWQR